MKKTALLIVCIVLFAVTGVSANQLSINTPVPWPRADRQSEGGISLPDFSGPEWGYDVGRWWNLSRDTGPQYTLGYYWHLHNQNTREDGALATMFDSPEIVLMWHWQERNKDSTVTTYLKIQDGTWVKGALGQYQKNTEICGKDGDNIAIMIITLEGEGGKIYRRYFIAP